MSGSLAAQLLLPQTRIQNPQASQVQLLGQEVLEARVTPHDEDELGLDVAHHLPLPYQRRR